jgi:hypothetical protein
VLVGLPAAWAADDAKPKPDEKKDAPKAKKPATPADEYRALVTEYSTAQQEFFKVYRTAKTNEERSNLVATKYPRPEKFAGRFIDFVDRYPDEPTAFDAVLWIVQNVRAFDPASRKVTERAIDILAKKYIEEEKLTGVVQSLAYSQSPSVEKLLRTAIEKSPHAAVQGHASFSLAQFLKNRVEAANYYKGADPKQLEQIKMSLGAELLEFYQNVDAEKVGKEVESLCETVVEKYGDLKGNRGSLGEAAGRELFEIRHLSIGKVAPEVEGEDIDGVAFKLSDYRGKVVVIDFWGDW